VPRLLVVDENVSKRVAQELKRRGRNATTVAALKLKGVKDPDLLMKLYDLDEDCVLITADDDMPASHAAVVERLQSTLAIVYPWDETRPLPVDAWEHEICQKWAHRMEEQPRGSIIRYSLDRATRWKLRKRPRRRP
jgi:hypothetical protein